MVIVVWELSGQKHVVYQRPAFCRIRGHAARRWHRAAQYNQTAVLAVNDAMAIGAIDTARAVGCSVPKSLAITGFDDIEAAGRSNVALTTVHIPKRYLGCIAADRHYPGRTSVVRL